MSQMWNKVERGAWKRRRRAMIGLVLCFSIGFLLAAVPLPKPVLADRGTGAVPVVRCEPEIVSGELWQTLVVKLYVENVTNLYGVDFQLAFDPAIGQVVDENANQPGVQLLPLYTWLVPGFIVRNEANNTAGTIWYAATQTYPEPAKNGSGSVAQVRFTFTPGGTSGCFVMPFTNHQLSAPGGVPIANVARDCRVCFDSPTGVTLATFRAKPGPGHAITVMWKTRSEVDNLGFNVYRSEIPDGEYVKVNLALIPTKVPPGSPIGASYKWKDRLVQSGITYYYWLEDIDIYGHGTMHGPVWATAR